MGKTKFHHFWLPPGKFWKNALVALHWKKSFRRPCLEHDVSNEDKTGRQRHMLQISLGQKRTRTSHAANLIWTKTYTNLTCRESHIQPLAFPDALTPRQPTPKRPQHEPPSALLEIKTFPLQATTSTRASVVRSTDHDRSYSRPTALIRIRSISCPPRNARTPTRSPLARRTAAIRSSPRLLCWPPLQLQRSVCLVA